MVHFHSQNGTGTGNTTDGLHGAETLPCVLLVEDDLAARWLMRSALKGRCQLISASNGEEALKAYHLHRPEVVVLDYRLPQQSGDVVLDMILEEDPNACIITMSGEENIEAMKAMIAAGARGMLTKPFSKEEFLRLVLGDGIKSTFFTKGDE